MILVEIFKETDKTLLKEKINEFLASGKVREVIDIKFSTCVLNTIHDPALVIYKTNNPRIADQ